MLRFYIMNSFFNKRTGRCWTLRYPNDATRNEIDFILIDKRRMVIQISCAFRFTISHTAKLLFLICFSEASLRLTLGINCIFTWLVDKSNNNHFVAARNCIGNWTFLDTVSVGVENGKENGRSGNELKSIHTHLTQEWFISKSTFVSRHWPMYGPLCLQRKNLKSCKYCSAMVFRNYNGLYVFAMDSLRTAAWSRVIGIFWFHLFGLPNGYFSSTNIPFTIQLSPLPLIFVTLKCQFRFCNLSQSHWRPFWWPLSRLLDCAVSALIFDGM